MNFKLGTQKFEKTIKLESSVRLSGIFLGLQSINYKIFSYVYLTKEKERVRPQSQPERLYVQYSIAQPIKSWVVSSTRQIKYNSSNSPSHILFQRFS